jgi:predicted nucleic acid-binding protein
MHLPDPTALQWVTIRQPVSTPVLPLVTDLGPGETAVLALALESTNAVVILDDALARQVAAALAIPFRGTLGVLLDAKRAGLVPTILPLLDQLHALRFRLSMRTREAILALAGETPYTLLAKNRQPRSLVIGRKSNDRTQEALGDDECREGIVQRRKLLEHVRC